MTKSRESFSSTYLNLRSLPFWLIHAFAIGLWWVVPLSLRGLAVSAAVYAVGMFFVTGSYHRYFSHRTYKTSRAFQFVLAWCAQTVCQKGVLWWASAHRHHHKHSDKPTDIHSVVQDGFWWAHMGWFLSKRHQQTDLSTIRDFARYPELRILNIPGIDIVPAAVYGVATCLIGGTYGFLYAAALPLTFLWHGTFTINSLAHLIGRTRYKTTDHSRNSLILALITHGEGWHNNHHHYQRTVRQGFHWYQIDVTYYVLRILAAIGLIRDLASVPDHVVKNVPNPKRTRTQTRGQGVVPLAATHSKMVDPAELAVASVERPAA